MTPLGPVIARAPQKRLIREEALGLTRTEFVVYKSGPNHGRVWLDKWDSPEQARKSASASSTGPSRSP